MALALQGTKHFVLLDPVSLLTNATNNSNSVDTSGYDELQIVLTRGTHATDAMATLLVQSSDDNSTWATVAGYVSGTDYAVDSMSGGTNAASSKPAAVFNIDLRGKKRYFRLGTIAPSGTAAIVGVTATLDRASVTTTNASGAGVSVIVQPS